MTVPLESQRLTSQTPSPAPGVLAPADPRAILSERPAQRRRGGGLNLFVLVCVAVVAGQLFLPQHLKPLTLAGQGAADFYGEIMREDNLKQLELFEQQRIAEKLADLRSDYAVWTGRCAMAQAFDAQLGAICYQAAESYYQNALREIERSRVYTRRSSS